jgi:hypothetical protein
VRRIKTHSHRQVPGLIQDGFDLFKPRAHRRAHPGRIFDENSHPAEFHSLCRMAHALSDFGNGLFPVGPEGRTRMRDEKIRAQRYRANQLIMKRLDRPRAHHSFGRRQIDQVVVMNNEWPEAQLRAARPKSRRIRLRNT